MNLVKKFTYQNFCSSLWNSNIQAAIALAQKQGFIMLSRNYQIEM